MIDKEIIDDFIEETSGLISGLIEILEKLEDSEDEFPKQLLEDFSQQIDRIMGSATTMEMMAPGHPGLPVIGKLTELCKKMGYNAAATNQVKMVPIFAAFWSDVVEVMESILANFEKPEEMTAKVQGFIPFLQKRLEWLYKKIPKAVYGKDDPIEEGEEAGDLASNLDLDDFIKNLLG